MATRQTVITGGFEIPVVSVRGEPRHCGRQYGAALKESIHGTLRAYLDAFRHHHGLSPDAVYELAAAYLPIIHAYDVGTLEEIRGIAEGAALPLEAILALNARSELVYGLTARLADGCTSFAAVGAATADGRTLLGQNWDWKPSVRASTTILAIARDGDPPVLTLTEAGLVGKIGFNGAGIGLVTNFLLSDRRRIGTPVHLIRRKILTAWTLGDAIGAVLGADRALAANYLIGHADGQVIDLEAWPDDVLTVQPTGDLLTHANHFQTPPAGFRDLGKRIFPDSVVRDVRLRRLLAQKPGSLDAPSCQAALRDHFNLPDAICRHADPRDPEGDRIETLGSVVIDLTDRVLHFCSGPPCRGEYVSLPLEPAA